MRLIFLVAYASSGLAGLIYESAWARVLSLTLGHTTAAATTAVAAMMAGLATGSLVGGRLVHRLSRSDMLVVYAALEIFVALTALAFPHELRALTPLLRWAYGDSPGLLFGWMRVAVSFTLLLLPAVSLGATFPLAVAWFDSSDRRARWAAGGLLYAANTAGAAIGSIASGFLLLPAVGARNTMLVGVAAGALSVVAVVWLRVQSQRHRVEDDRLRPKQTEPKCMQLEPSPGFALAAVAAAGFASLAIEITWTRALSAVVGPTTYAFAATLASIIAGTAIGSAIGVWVSARTRLPVSWIVLSLSAAAVSAMTASGLVGMHVPRAIAQELALSTETFNVRVAWNTLESALLLLPTAICLGAIFPLALRPICGSDQPVPRRVSLAYAANSVAAVGGAFAAGFLLIPRAGLENTVSLVAVSLIVVSVAGLCVTRMARAQRAVGITVVTLAVGAVFLSPSWDRRLLASGVYKYAPYVNRELDLEAALTAGTLLYYRDGAASTISVKRLTGTLSMAIDGKVDASNGADMATQKLLAHLPLMLHPQARRVAIIGLGSGVTLGAALVHPIDRADVVEISPQVIEASHFFIADNHDALADERVDLIVGDGRSHMLYSSRTYDVVISEPSNPWMAGVAALFTREFLAAVRDRLEPEGIVCQWAHIYDMREEDLKSIVATFIEAFPNGTLWLIGGDVLLVGSKSDRQLDVAALDTGYRRPGVSDDLRHASVMDAFSVLSLFVSSSDALRKYVAGASSQVDDRMALEFSGPEAIAVNTAAGNLRAIHGISGGTGRPSVVQSAFAVAGPLEWRNQGAMMITATDYQVGVRRVSEVSLARSYRRQRANRTRARRGGHGARQ